MFSGYIPFRRGILDHIRQGRLNHTDFSAYSIILLETDCSTGLWFGSAKALGPYNFPLRTARRCLERLEAGGYLKRFPVPGRHSNYPVVVNKYAITRGAHKGKLTDTTRTRSWKEIVYWSEDVAQHVDQQVAPSQEVRKENENKKKRKNTAQASPSLPGFEAFWKAYPRKVGKPAARGAWKAAVKKASPVGKEPSTENLFEAPRVIAGLERWKQTEQWQKEGGQFIPYPATFLNQRRWEDDPPAREQSKDAAVGRGPQPSDVQPLTAEARKALDERQRLDAISDLEGYLAEGQGNASLRGKCRKRLEGLRAKPAVKP